MTKRVLLAGLLGGIAMFIWSFVAHEILPLGEAGVTEIPNEAAVLSAMRSSIGDAAGFYIFPGMGRAPNASSQQKQAAMQQYEQKLAANPSGLLIYHPPGAKLMFGQQLTTEFVTEVIESLLAVILLAQAHLLSYSARVGFVFLTGVVASIATNISYWNWYGFPGSYTVWYVATGIIGFLIVGLIAAAIVKAKSTLTHP
jgi:hypothetical protein